MYVEPFERASTVVWTFRLPYLVFRAVGIFAASALISSGLGFSITRFACGRRNSIFATSIQLLSVGPDGGSYRGDGPATLGRRRFDSVSLRGGEARCARDRRGSRRYARGNRGPRGGRGRRASVEDSSGAQPLRRGRGRDQRGARKRVRGQ